MDYGGGSGGGCCRCCSSFIISLGLTALFLWLSLRASNPSISVNVFEVPILNKALDSTTNTTVFVVLRLANGNKDKGINYDDLTLTLTLSYLPNATDRRRVSPIGNATVPRFYQGHKKKATKGLNFSAAGFNWTGVRARLFADDLAAATFRVDLVTALRFKIMAWRTKRHRVELGADVAVNHLGTKVNKKGEVNKKGVKLSGGDRIGNSGFVTGVLVSFFGVWVFNGFW